MSTETIYVELLNEDIEVWAPVEAERITGNEFRLPSTAPEDQEWAFPPGSRVLCETRSEALTAVALAGD